MIVKYLLRDLFFYRKIILLLIASVAICTMVVASALFVGDSIHYTLKAQVASRLDQIESIYQGDYVIPMNGLLRVEGFVRLGGVAQKVTLYGVEDSLLKEDNILANEAFINYFKPNNHDYFQFYFKPYSFLNTGSLVGNSVENLSSKRLCFLGKYTGSYANIDLVNTPVPAMNLFINRAYLSKIYGVEEGANCIPSMKSQAKLAQDIEQNLSLNTLGLYCEKDTFKNITHLKSKRYFLPSWLASVVTGDEVLTLFAKSWGENQYFFISGIEKSYLGTKKNALFEHANLKISQDDLNIFCVDSFGNINTKSMQLSLNQKDIFVNDHFYPSSFLTPTIPGLTDANDCKSWKNDFVSLDSITKLDEFYWKAHGVTPKLFLDIELLRQVDSQYANACTSLILSTALDTAKIFECMMKEEIVHFISSPRSQAIEGANNGVNYLGIFIGLSLFLLISALIVQRVILNLVISHRQQDFELIRAIGLSEKWIKKLFFFENLFITIVGITLGMIGSYYLAWGYLNALQTIWNDALGFQIIIFHGSEYSILMTILIVMINAFCYSLRIKNLNPPHFFRSKTVATLSFLHIAFRNVLRFKQDNQWIVILIFLATIILGCMTFIKNITYFKSEDYIYFYETKLPYNRPIQSIGKLKTIHIVGDDDASCKNPYQVTQPKLFITQIDDIELLKKRDVDSFYIAGYAEKSVMDWVMKRSIGDTIDYVIDGKNYQVQLVGYTTNNLFQGGIVVDQADFPNYKNARCFWSGNDDLKKLTDLLEPLGLQTKTLEQHIAIFDAVQNRYIAIFAFLGWIGLGLGIAGAVIIFLRQFYQRKDEFKLLEDLGYAQYQTLKIRLYECCIMCGGSLLLGTCVVACVVIIYNITQ